MSEHEENLLLEILQELEIDHQYMRFFRPEQEEKIALIRKLGRKAGRRLGWKIRTMQTDPAAREDGQVIVLVVVEESTQEDEKRMKDRTALIISRMDILGGEQGKVE